MSNVTKNIKKTKHYVNSIGHPSDKCCVTDCTEDADIKILIAKNQKGFVVNADDCGIIVGSGENISLRSGYTFVRWVSRCRAHYGQDIARANRSALENVRRNHTIRIKNSVDTGTRKA